MDFFHHYSTRSPELWANKHSNRHVVSPTWRYVSLSHNRHSLLFYHHGSDRWKALAPPLALPSAVWLQDVLRKTFVAWSVLSTVLLWEESVFVAEWCCWGSFIILSLSGRSIGVLAYVMLTGISPFLGDDKQETFLNISQINVSYTEEELEQLDGAAVHFIKSLLIKEPE